MLVWSQIFAALAQYRNLSCSNEATNYFCNSYVLVASNDVYDLRPQDHPFVDKDLRLDQFSIIRLRNCSSRVNLSVWRCSIPCLPASYRIGVREVVLYLWRSREWKRGPSCSWWISDFPLFLFARSARTCSRRCLRPSMISILCTSLWVPFRAIHTIQDFQLDGSFVLILGWRD